MSVIDQIINNKPIAGTTVDSKKIIDEFRAIWDKIPNEIEPYVIPERLPLFDSFNFRVPRKLKKKIKRIVFSVHGRVCYKITGIDKIGNGFYIQLK